MKLTFGKNKKLKSRKAIEKVFSAGQSIHRFPVRAVFYYEPEGLREFRIGVSVPKRKFKRATERNLLKRRIREAVRINQTDLVVPGRIHIMFIYSAGEIIPYSEIEKSVIALFDSLNSISVGQSEEK